MHARPVGVGFLFLITRVTVTAAHDRTHGTDLLDAVNGWVVVGDCDEMGVQTSVR